MPDKKLFNEFVKKVQELYKPKGSTDRGGRWYPTNNETFECCGSIKSPSRAYPWTYYKHCFTIKHIKNYLKSIGIKSVKDLPLLINQNDYIGRAAKETFKKETVNA